MLKQMARLCRLLALLHDNEFGGPLEKDLARILEPGDKTKPVHPKELDSSNIALFLSKALELGQDEYNLIKQYLNDAGSPYHSYMDFPHPEHALILPPNAKRLTELHDNGRTYSRSSSHSGNSAIHFYNRKTQDRMTGAIESILEIPLEGFLRKFILLRPHRALSDLDTMCTPYPQFPRMRTKVVDTVLSDSILVIEPQHIITHLTTFKRPAGTYGIPTETLVICWALDRGLK